MPPGHASSRRKGISAETADQLYEALEPVQQELKRRHIPCLRVMLISLELRDAQPCTFPRYHMPALEIWDRQGKIVAAVTPSVDLSRFYLVVPAEQSKPYVVPAEAPE
ncbi:hypothetical protein [Nonomuraea ceibae]|uniref:hypothetical protein n=1 Tax=Nonomuraea ceibae TaxID=1935170 RepID=UPI001C5FA980|nr:hypothetical protein [Nonomuraea ceibae]